MRYTFIIMLAAAVSFMLTGAACSKKANETNANAAASEENVKANENAAESKAEEAPKAEEAKEEETAGDPPFNPEAEAKEESISSTVSPKGTVLQIRGLPLDLEVISTKGTVHGPYAIEMMYSGMVVFSTERLQSEGKDAESIQSIVAEIEKERDVQKLVIEKSSDLKNIVLPVYKVTYLTGHNEDTRECRDYYIHGQEFDYRFHTSIPGDFVDEYKGIVDKWIKDIELVENDNAG